MALVMWIGLFAVLVLPVWSCSSWRWDASTDTGGPADSGQGDAPADWVAGDAVTDASTDASPDAPQDMESRTEPVDTLDTLGDVKVDTLPDMLPNTVTDTATDTDTDTLPDALPDTLPDLEPEVCTPDCIGPSGVAYVCGPDACGGDCGTCTDGDLCTTDLCQDHLCVFDAESANGSDCDDGNPCTAGDQFGTGVCAGTLLPLGLLAGLECRCADDADCQPLDDGDVCNGTLTCVKALSQDQVGICAVAPATVRTCSDEVVCTTEVCDPVQGCVVTPRDDQCDDLNPCTENHCAPSGCDFATLAEDGTLCGGSQN